MVHRGQMRVAPENTLPSLEKALRLKADFVEIDVRTSQDRQFFLLHDDRLDRTTNGKGLVAETAAEVLNRLDAGAWFGRPFVSTALLSFDGFLSHLGPATQIYLDAKEISAKALVAVLEQHGAIEKTVVYGFPDYLVQWKNLQPQLHRMPALRSAADLNLLVEKVRPFALDTAWEILSKPLIDRCHATGVKVFSDSLGRHEHIQDYLQAMEWGIDLIQTDHPLRFFHALELYVRAKATQSPKPGMPNGESQTGSLKRGADLFTVQHKAVKEIGQVPLLNWRKIHEGYTTAKVDGQAYRLTITSTGIRITGNSDQGLFYVVQTLLQLLKPTCGGKLLLPAGEIEDWPATSLRFLHWDTKHHQDRMETLKRYLDWSARFKVNMIGFELEDKFEYPAHPIIGAPGAFTVAEMQEIVRYGLERFIQVVPQVQAPAHMAYVLKNERSARRTMTTTERLGVLLGALLLYLVLGMALAATATPEPVIRYVSPPIIA